MISQNGNEVQQPEKITVIIQSYINSRSNKDMKWLRNGKNVMHFASENGKVEFYEMNQFWS